MTSLGLGIDPLLERLGRRARLAILAGPSDDRRSQQRVEGFQSLAPDVPVYGASTLEALVAGSVAPRRFVMSLLGLFALATLLMMRAGSARPAGPAAG